MFSLAMIAETIRAATPYACAAIGGIWAERSGVIQIGLEGVLISSAFASVAAAHATGSAAAGLVAGVVVGALLSVAHGALIERARVNAIVSGVALNLLALAGTRVLLRGIFGSSSSSPWIDGFRAGPAGDGGAELLARALLNPALIAAVIAAAATPWVLARTRFGLRTRASGESPAAAASVGINVERIRYAALAISGAVCALGGAHLAFAQHRFEPGMSGGRGFVALAVVVVSGWKAGNAVLACLIFGALEALPSVLERAPRPSYGGELRELIPYVATLVVLAFAAGQNEAPRGLGKRADE